MNRVQQFLRDTPKAASEEGGLLTSFEAILFAARSQKPQAEAAIQRAIEVGHNFGHFHHSEHNIASAYALMHKNKQAVEWLQRAAREGLPCYPLFERDPNLNNLRSDPQFIAFMAQLKKQWEGYQRL